MAQLEKAPPRIRYADEDDIEGHGHRRDAHRVQRLSRASSDGSLSIHTVNRTVQPEAALPITYRTLSIEVDEDLQNKKNAIKRAKENGTVGKKPSSTLIPCVAHRC
jgi:sodium/potassium-transporting ATPase subunit alpha